MAENATVARPYAQAAFETAHGAGELARWGNVLDALGIAAEDVQVIYLAGAFGNYIRPESALAIGLMPRFPNARIVPVGNAAGSGARMALLSRGALREASAILQHTEYLELSGRPDFQEEFAEAMTFGT
mgnify:CR=1 FL=1